MKGRLPFHFYLFLAGMFVSVTGNFLQMVAQGWLVAQLTPDPFWVGVVGFCGGVPWLVFALIGGGLADRFSRRRYLFLCQSGMMLVSGALAWLVFTKAVSLWHVAALAFFSGVFSALNAPAYQAFLFDIVGKTHVTRAVSWNGLVLHLGRLFGPWIAGVLIDELGMWECFALDSISFLAFLPVIAFVPVREVPLVTREGSAVSLLHGLRGALSHVGTRPLILLSLWMTGLTTVLIFPHVGLMPLFVKEVLHEQAGFLSQLWVCSSVGSLASTLVFPRLTAILWGRGKQTFFIASALSGLFLIFFSQSREFLHLAVTVAGIASAMTFVTLLSQSVIQNEVDSRYRGRVMGMWNTLFQGMFPVGALLVGSLAQGVGIPAAWCVASVALWVALILLTRILHLDSR